MADNMDADDAPKTSACEKVAKFKGKWTSKDLEILQSGLFADAEIICNDGESRKVHRGILASRSEWFKKALDDAVTEEGVCKIKMDQTAWNVDLFLYFIYVGHIDLDDKTLTGGHGKMILSVKLLRLGKALQEWNLYRHGRKLLETHTKQLLLPICDSNATAEENEARFNEVSVFVSPFCWAVRDAFDAKQPVMVAQALMAVLAFQARAHLFKNTKFMRLTRTVPAFGTLVLSAVMTGGFVFTPGDGCPPDESTVA